MGRVFVAVAGLGLAALALVFGLVVAYDAGSQAVGRAAHEVRLMLWAALLGCLALAAVVACGWALRELVRAWRTPVQLPPERHVVRETRIIDGQKQPVIMQPYDGMQPVYPQMIRAMYGELTRQQPAQLAAPEGWQYDEDEEPATRPEWHGVLRP